MSKRDKLCQQWEAGAAQGLPWYEQDWLEDVTSFYCDGACEARLIAASPIDREFKNLTATVDWLRTHDDAARVTRLGVEAVACTAPRAAGPGAVAVAVAAEHRTGVRHASRESGRARSCCESENAATPPRLGAAPHAPSSSLSGASSSAPGGTGGLTGGAAGAFPPPPLPGRPT